MVAIIFCSFDFSAVFFLVFNNTWKQLLKKKSLKVIFLISSQKVKLNFSCNKTRFKAANSLYVQPAVFI